MTANPANPIVTALIFGKAFVVLFLILGMVLIIRLFQQATIVVSTSRARKFPRKLKADCGACQGLLRPGERD